jgi:hypothetical protein
VSVLVLLNTLTFLTFLNSLEQKGLLGKTLKRLKEPKNHTPIRVSFFERRWASIQRGSNRLGVIALNNVSEAVREKNRPILSGRRFIILESSRE